MARPQGRQAPQSITLNYVAPQERPFGSSSPTAVVVRVNQPHSSDRSGTPTKPLNPPRPPLFLNPSPPPSSRQGRAARWSSSPRTRTPERRCPTARRRRSSCTPTRTHLVWCNNYKGCGRAAVTMVAVVPRLQWLRSRCRYNGCGRAAAAWLRSCRSYNGCGRTSATMVAVVPQLHTQGE